MKTKRLLSVLTLAVLLPYTALAEEWQDPITKVNYETMGSSNGYYAIVVKSPKATGDITIRSTITINGYQYPVTYIWTQAFDDNNNITSVTIPGSIIGIDPAFRGCSNLKEVTIQEGVTYIGTGAFMNCSSLTQVTIPKSVTDIGNTAFANCSSLTSVTIPEGITRIESWTFQGCSSLKEVVIPSTMTFIGGYVFANCSSLESVTIPETVTFIADYAFSGCSSLTEVTIPGGVTDIRPSTFEGCSGLTEVIIQEGVTSIGKKAFSGCSGLTKVTIPEGVTTIGERAFAACSSLTKVTIPSSVTSISNTAFSECSGLTSIIVESGNTVYDSRDNCNAIIETASNTLFLGCQNTVIPLSITSIGDYAFGGCTSLTEVTIPSSVTSIGNSAFRGCTSLTEVTIPSNVTSIGNSAFYNCRGLTSVTSLIQEPFIIDPGVFWILSEQEYLSGSFTTATLYVPKGTKEKYKATAGWKEFTNIVEMEDDDPTNVEAITNHSENMVTERYALGGQRVSGQQRSLNIERMSDGTIKKVMVR